MTSFLLNVWRENGAYLRFADAKNTAIAALSTTLLVSYYKYVYIIPSVNWNILEIFKFSHADEKHILVLFLLFFSMLISTLSVLPTLSKGSWRTNFFNQLGTSVGVLPSPEGATSIVYFLDIAAHPNLESYETALSSMMGYSMGPEEQAIASQVWSVSRIAAAKYMQNLISIFLLLFGVFLALFV